MTAEKLAELLEAIRTLDTQSGMQVALENVSSTLANLTNAPAEPSYQSALATHLSKLDASVNDATMGLTPSEYVSIASIGGGEYFDPALARRVRASVAENAMTPSVARDFVKGITTARAQFLRTVNETLAGLTSLGIEGYVLTKGEADLSFTIPREIFSDKLGSFAVELRFLDKLLNDLSEATLGQVHPPELEALSTTTPIVSVLTDHHVLAALAKAVGAFLAAWKTIEEIRKVRADVAKIGVTASLEPFDEKIEETVTEVVEETVKVCLSPYEGDEGRQRELDTALRQDFRRLFGQIERGLVVDFRSRPENEASNADADPLIAVREESRNFEYPTPTTQPLLLSSGEVLEGEITRTTKRSKTTSRSRRVTAVTAD